MIFPVGHEQSSVRRLPWVTFAIMAACILTHVFVDMDAADGYSEREQYMEDAASYWRDHPYLEAATEVRTEVGYDVMPNQREQYLAMLPDLAINERPTDREVLEAQQAELDRLTDLAVGKALPDGMSADSNPYVKWGVVPEDIQVATLITHMFFHAGWIHLLSNLFIFFLAGPPIEDRLGRPLFAALYLCSGVFAALFWSALSVQKNIPMVGASGAIAGMLGAFLLLYWNTKIKFLYFFFVGLRPFFGSFRAEAWLMLPLWFGTEVFQGWMMNSIGVSGGVAYFAHAGGFLFGAGSLVAIKAFKVEERFIHDVIESKVTVAEANPLIEEAMTLRADGKDELALQLLEENWSDNRDDRDFALTLWDTACRVGRPEEGVEAARGLVAMSSSDDDKGAAIQHWMDLIAACPDVLAAPTALMRFVPVLSEEGNPELAIKALRHATDPGNAGFTPGLAMKAIDLARELDPPSALRAARIAAASPDLHEVKRERLQQLVSEFEASGIEDVPDVATEARAQREAAQTRTIDLLPDDWEDPSGRPIEFDPAGDTLSKETPENVGTPANRALGSDGSLVESNERGGSEPAAESSADSATVDAPDLFDIASTDSIARFSEAKIVEAIPVALTASALKASVGSDRTVDVDYRKIEAMAVAVINEPNSKPVLLIDLLLNWNSLDDLVLRVIRLQSNRFDPRKLVPGFEDPMPALRRLIGELARCSNAEVLPGPELLEGAAFETFDDFGTYRRVVLQAEGE